MSLEGRPNAGADHRDRDSVTLAPHHTIGALDTTKWQQTLREDSEAGFVAQQRLLANQFYRIAAPRGDETICGNIARTTEAVPAIVDFLSSVHENVLHLSLAGSATFKPAPNDLDFNVVIGGTHFEYDEHFHDTTPQLFDELNFVNKISFIIFGERDLVEDTGVNDSIQTPGYLHEDIIARELLVYKLRNLLLYGHDIDTDIPLEDIMQRVLTGLSFASRTLRGEVPRYDKNDVQARKAGSRIDENMLILRALCNDNN